MIIYIETAPEELDKGSNILSVHFLPHDLISKWFTKTENRMANNWGKKKSLKKNNLSSEFAYLYF